VGAYFKITRYGEYDRGQTAVRIRSDNPQIDWFGMNRDLDSFSRYPVTATDCQTATDDNGLGTEADIWLGLGRCLVRPSTGDEHRGRRFWFDN